MSISELSFKSDGLLLPSGKLIGSFGTFTKSKNRINMLNTMMINLLKLNI